MATNALLNNDSIYAGNCIILTTKHAKSIAISPVFWEKIKASVIEYVVDTDLLGTFTGEIERKENPLECARKKCEWSLNKLGNKVKFAIASEGSFGPHPVIPFLPCNHEILYFIDRQRDFHLHISCLSTKTNYRSKLLDSLENLKQFAKVVQFPSHAIIMRPYTNKTEKPIFKGIGSMIDLEAAFIECIKYSTNKKVLVETDMRAQYNPSRMTVIAELATNLAERLKKYCPQCNLPGWGKIKQINGLECSKCNLATNLVKLEISGCVKCAYEETNQRADGITKADPGNCQYCNP